jgi:competence protein ComEC
MSALLEIFRDWLTGGIQQSLPEPQASLLLGMLLGARERLPGGFYEALLATGTLHVVVVSGFNITIIINALGKVLAFLPLKPRFLVILGVVVVFVALVGFEAPVVRAAIMGATALLATVLGRQKDALRALVLAAIVMLLLRPSWASSVSFQLSFLASLGLIIIYPLLNKKLPGKNLPLREDLLTTLSAQFLVWPLIAYHFGRVSLISPLANLLVLWTVPPVTILGAFLALLASFVKEIGYLIMLPINLFLTYFVEVVGGCASLGWGDFEISPFSLSALLFFYLALGGGLWLFGQLSLQKESND